MANGNEDKRVNYLGDPYTMQDDGFSWDFKDSELIDFYTDKESGDINWDRLEEVRSIRDGFMANEQWEGDPHISTSRKRGLADLDEGFYDYGEGTNKDGYKFQNYMRYPTINQRAYSEKSDIRRTAIEDKLIDEFSNEESIY